MVTQESTKRIKALGEWYTDVEDKEKRTDTLLASMHIFNDLRDFYSKLIRQRRNQLEGITLFETPNWDNRTAYELGIIAGVKLAKDCLPEED